MAFQLANLCQSAAVAIRTTESRTEKIADAVPSHGNTRRSTAEAKNIHVVVLHTLASREIVMTKSSSYSSYLVRGHRSSDSAATNQDTPFYLPARDRAGEGNGEVRIIIVRIAAVIPEVHDLMSFFSQARGELLLHIEAAVICADTNFHRTLPLHVVLCDLVLRRCNNMICVEAKFLHELL